MSILIISSKVDPTTDEVIDWLDFYEKKFTRIEINELFQKQSVNFFLSEGSSGLHFFIENRKVNVSSAWIRADSSYKPKPEFNSNNKELVQLVEKHLEKEFRELKRGVLNSTSLKKIRWLNSYYKLNKIRVLAEAKKVGLKIPKTLITNNKVDLLQFLEGCEKIICKAISSSLLLKTEKLSNPYFQYTNEVKKEDLDKLPDSFFPSLFQELIEKMIDVRLVFIREKVFPVGIFSQAVKATSIDCRNYDHENRNRVVPINFPERDKQKVIRLMSNLEMNFGCLDFIMDKNGEVYFLEVNPLGQFGMISYICNLYLEQEVAKSLDHE